MRAAWWLLLGTGGMVSAEAERRFPRPNFRTDYVPPEQPSPLPRLQLFEALDVLVLLAALLVAVVLLFRRRSRRGVVLLSVFSIVYFGFWRRGCVCAVGSVQNVALACGDAQYAIPWTVLAFFALPLVFALFFGRVFCSGVCPLGAVQDLLVWRPVRVPLWLAHVLGMIPWAILALAILFAATATGFPVCRWDPFVGIFRLGMPFGMAAVAGIVLLVSLFVGRPYCRFFCPYGALLGFLSRFSWKHVRIAPEECVQCRLCEEACPYGAIRAPRPVGAPEPRRTGVRRLALIAAAAPLAVAAAVGAGYGFGRVLSMADQEVTLAREIRRQGGEQPEDAATMSLQAEAFYTSGRTPQQLYDAAHKKRQTFAAGGALAGAALALVGCAALVRLSVWRSQKEYEPDRAMCLSCARCFAYCPVEQRRRRAPRAEGAGTSDE